MKNRSLVLSSAAAIARSSSAWRSRDPITIQGIARDRPSFGPIRRRASSRPSGGLEWARSRIPAGKLTGQDGRLHGGPPGDQRSTFSTETVGSSSTTIGGRWPDVSAVGASTSSGRCGRTPLARSSARTRPRSSQRRRVLSSTPSPRAAMLDIVAGTIQARSLFNLGIGWNASRRRRPLFVP